MHRRPTPRYLAGTAPAGLVAGCVAAWAGAIAVTIAGGGEEPVRAGAVQAVVVGTPLAVGLFEWRPRSPFPRLLVVIGLGLAVVSLSATTVPLLYSLGRIALWCLSPVVIAMLLAYPSGRLDRPLDRVLVALSLGVVAVLYLGPLPWTVEFPGPFPWASCTTGCPDNAFAVVDTQPAVLDDVIRPVREAAVVVLMGVLTVVLARRTLAARPVLRAWLVPVLAAAAVHTLLYGAYVATRAVSDDEALITGIGTAALLSYAVIAMAFAAARVMRTVHAAGALERLAHAMRAGPGGGDVSRTMADALEDPSLRLVVKPPAGRAAAPELPAAGSGVTPITVGEQPAAVVLHDELLDDEPELVRAAGEIALLRLDNDRLVDRLSTLLEQLTESRSRLLEAGDRQRRRIERDLHDGAQQGLVGLRIRLSMLEDRLRGVAPAEAETARELGEQVDDAIEQVRSLARGIYPSLLTDHGLRAALRSVARASALPTTVDVRQSVRYRAGTESTIYFTCLEALQNAVKHAADATAVHVAVWEVDGEVLFEVRDDGAGFDGGPRDGSGLAGMRDRVAAAGGTLTIAEADGGGVRVAGSLRLAPAGASGPSRWERPGIVQGPVR